ncbi:MAG: KTSC domain-containing protein [Enterococcus sp.]|jgi:hypothetical protein|nr:KTSC domain-containing protein [Bacteroidales bacterium]NLM68364.1 KTSC domain-containing protein [Enterococcus sp.]
MSLPEMHPVSSSNVDSIGYDESTETLYVRFLNNTLYLYKGVSIMVFEQLLNAPSIGSYMHRNIKGVYPYERIE